MSKEKSKTLPTTTLNGLTAIHVLTKGPDPTSGDTQRTSGKRSKLRTANSSIALWAHPSVRDLLTTTEESTRPSECCGGEKITASMEAGEGDSECETRWA